MKSERLQVRVKIPLARKFLTIAKRMGESQAEAMRVAIKNYIASNRKKLGISATRRAP